MTDSQQQQDDNWRDIFMAKVAEEAERYDDMVDHLRSIIRAKQGKPLTQEEKTLFSVAYKHKASSIRTALRVVTAVLKSEEGKRGKGYNETLVKGLRERMQHELEQLCGEVISLLENNLIPTAGDDDEGQVFYYKM